MNNFINRYIKASYIIAIPIAIIMLLFKDRFKLILSLLFSNTIRILLFKISGIELNNILNKPKTTAKILGAANYIKRFLIYGITLAVCEKSPYLNFYGGVIGILLLTFSIHLLNLKDIKESGKKFDEIMKKDL